MKRIKRRMAGIILIVMLLTILLSPGSFSAWADKTDDAADDEFDISAIIDNGDDVIVVPAEDSADPIVPDENITDEESPYKVGDIITFGKYEQDGDIENGKEDIEWQVLKVEEDRVLVVSKYALDCQPYDTEDKDVTWETCSLRSWLNNDFKDNAFTPEEQKMIPEVTVTNGGNPYYGTSGGNDTQDQIFCLSLNEIESLIGYSWYDEENMYGYSQRMIAEPTEYAIERGAYSYKITEDNCAYLKDYGFDDGIKEYCGCWWWLRSPGFDNRNACSVYSNGLAGKTHSICTSANIAAVRPALFVDIFSIERGDEEIEDPLVLPQEEIEEDIIDEVSDERTDEITDEITDDENQIKDEDSSEENDSKDTDVNPEEEKDVTDEDSSEENTDENADVAPDEKGEIIDETRNE